MKFVRSLSWVICTSVLILTVSCRSNSGLKKESSVPVSTELVSLANKVLANAQTSPSMTAKVGQQGCQFEWNVEDAQR